MQHISLAVSEQTLIKIFDVFRDRFKFKKALREPFGRFTAGYDVKAYLEQGSFDLRSDNTLQIKQLNIMWDRLDLFLGFDIPKICVGGFCIIPDLSGGCLLEAPSACVFEGNPDVGVTLRLGGITSQISVTGSLYTRLYKDPRRPVDMDDWAAREAVPSLSDKWQLLVRPQFVDIDPINISETVGDLLEKAVRAVIDNLLGWLPDKIKDIIWAIIGPVIDLIREILKIPDDIQEWLSDLLNTSLGLLNTVGEAIFEHIANKTPLFEAENPYPLLAQSASPNHPSEPDLVPVLLFISALSVFNNQKELVLEGTLG